MNCCRAGHAVPQCVVCLVSRAALPRCHRHGDYVLVEIPPPSARGTAARAAAAGPRRAARTPITPITALIAAMARRPAGGDHAPAASIVSATRTLMAIAAVTATTILAPGS